MRIKRGRMKGDKKVMIMMMVPVLTEEEETKLRGFPRSFIDTLGL